MSIQFTCPHCGAGTDVADEYAGQSGPCAACGRPITIPVLADALRRDSHAKGSQTAVVVIVLMVVAAVVGLFVCGGIFFFRMASVPVPLPPAQTMMNDCTNNLRRIGLAMHNYHDAYKCFPPAYIPDGDGEPMHSWRVLLLPYMEHQPVYDSYNFDEPWDSPNNLALADVIAQAYRCPEDNQSDPSETNYVMIVGPDTISDGPTARTIADIRDGTSNTMMVVEVCYSGIQCTEPRDLKAEQITFGINEGTLEGIRGEHLGGANLLFFDGTVHTFGSEADPARIRAMTTIAGGEVDGTPY